MNASGQRQGAGAAVLVLAALAVAAPCASQGADWLREHYDKQEAMVPMRDGARLFTAIYIPRGPGGPWPILLQRTPYSVAPYGAGAFPDHLGPSARFAREGFIFAYQDVRGRMMSEGQFRDMTPALARPGDPPDAAARGLQGVDESTDAYDTVAWLVRSVPGNSGRVGLWGTSYPGFYAAAALIDAHPALKAVSPQGPIMDWFAGDDFHRNGAFWLPHAFGYLAQFGRPRPEPTPRLPAALETGRADGYGFYLDLGSLANADRAWFKGEVPFWNQLADHGDYDGFWRARDLRPHLRDVRPAVLDVGGWFDAENLFGTLEAWRALARQSPDTERHLAMGPWSHGGWHLGAGDRLGAVRFGSATAEFFQERIEFPFFMHHLKDAPDALPRAWAFQTGANRWCALPDWPPPGVRRVSWFFQARARRGPRPEARAGSDAYPSDPARPVPYYQDIAAGMAKDYMTADQRFAGRRPDVLSYASPPLASDLTVAGPLLADLWVSTTGTDSDWVVKVIDAYPDDASAGPEDEEQPPLAGCQQLVRGEAFRGKYRAGLDRPEPFVPGRPTEVRFRLNDIFHTFRRGHRLMVQVQSSWFPLMDRNPQVFTDIYHAQDRDFRAAEERLYRGPGRSSRLVLPVLP